MTHGPYHSLRHLGPMKMEPGRCSACVLPSFDWTVCREKGCAALRIRAELEGVEVELDADADP